MLWQKIKSIFNTNEENYKNQESNKDSLDSIFKPEPNDVVFVKKFSAFGGHFIYCQNNEEITASIKSILSENNSPKIACFDIELQNILQNIGIDFEPTIKSSLKEELFLFIPCEYLIAFDGSIMVSSDQTKSYRLNELPYNVIVYSNFNQIATNLSFALSGIKKNKNDNIPNNITCMKGHNTEQFETVPNAKNIYLLMLE